MAPYIFFIFLTFVLSILFDGREDSPHKRFWYSVVCVYLILVAGLRYRVGGDTQSYMEDFAYIPLSSNQYMDYIREQITEESYMPGWTIITILCKRWFDSFYAIQIVEALFANICIFYLFKQYTTHIFLCALLYGITGQFFNFNTEVMREAFAIGICGIAIHQYLQGKHLKFYVLVLFSIFFHVSSIIVLLFPFFRLETIRIKTIIYAFLVSFVLWFISDMIMTYLPNLLSGELAVVDKVLSYSNSKSNIFGLLSSSLLYIVGQGMIIYFVNQYLDDDDERKTKFIHYASFHFLIATLACGFAGFNRFLNYTAIFILIMATEFIYHYKVQLKSLPIVKTILLIIFFAFPFMKYNIYFKETDRRFYEFFVPYTSINDEDQNLDYREYMYIEAVTPEKTAKNTRDIEK